MSPSPDASHAGRSIKDLTGRSVVIDASSRYVFIGTLADVTEKFVVLRDADAHDLRDTETTRDLYILDAKLHGVSVNRTEVWVRFEEIVDVSALDDVVG